MNDVSKLHVWSHIETIEPQHRLVLLGASNLTRAFPMVVRLALNTCNGPLSIHTAMGFGRSYGKESRFLLKKSLGIFQSKIWDALAQQKSFPTTAFMTDIGNDLAYEVPVDQLMEWVEDGVVRLQHLDAKIVITDVPLEALRAVGEVRYRIIRTLLFPQCRLDYTEMLCRVEQLSGQLKQLAKSRNIPLYIVNSEWYGCDPIHPRRARLTQIWRELFELVDLAPSKTSRRQSSIMMNWYLRGLRRGNRSPNSFFGCVKQPDGRLVDGTEIAIY